MPQLLGQMHVLEIGDDIGVRYCGRLLYLLGARVTRLSMMGSPFDEYFDDGKRVVDSDRDISGRVGVVVCSTSSSGLAVPSQFSKVHRVVISRNGLSEPSLTGLLSPYANSGYWWSEGDPGCPPLGPGVPVAQYAAALFAALAAVALFLSPGLVQSGREIDISESESLLRAMHTVTSIYSLTGVQQPRSGQPPFGLFEILDSGWLGVHALSADQMERLRLFLEHVAGVDIPKGLPLAELSPQKIEGALQRCGISTDELFRSAQEEWRLPFGKALSIPELLECPHLDARDAFRRTAAGHLLPRAPFRITATGGTRRPLATGGLLLEGVRVLDLSMWFAGPVASQVLAELGADVVKVESPTHMDGYRLARTEDGVAGRWNTSPLFNTYGRGKRSLALDLRDSDGLALFKRLVAQSDVVIDNFTPGVMERLGLTDQALFEINPSLVLCSLPAFGLSGPWRNYSGFAFSIEELAGWTALRGYKGGQPHGSRLGAADPISGLHAAVAIVAALGSPSYRGGSRVELSQQEALLELLGPALSVHATGAALLPDDGVMDYLSSARGGITRTFTADGTNWVAVDFDSIEKAYAAQAAIGLDEGPDDAAGRTSHLNAVAAELGVATYPILTPAEALDSELFLRRGAFETIDHPVTGLGDYARSPLAIGGLPIRDGVHAPLLGQDNDAVLRQLGLDGPAIAELRARGTVGERPDAAAYPGLQ